MIENERIELERLHKLAETFPKLHGHFSTGTGGVDVARLIEVLEDAEAEIYELRSHGNSRT